MKQIQRNFGQPTNFNDFPSPCDMNNQFAISLFFLCDFVYQYVYDVKGADLQVKGANEKRLDRSRPATSTLTSVGSGAVSVEPIACSHVQAIHLTIA